MKSLIATLFVLAVFAVSAIAQVDMKRVATGSPKEFMLLNPKVQAELKLSDGQKKKIAEAAGDVVSADEKGRVRVQIDQDTDLEAIKKDMVKVLTAEQLQRLTEVWIQQNGHFVLTDVGIAKALELTSDQKSRVESAMEDYGQAMHEAIMSSGGAVTPEVMKPAKEKAQKALAAILTESQQKKLDSMKGKPFKAS